MPGGSRLSRSSAAAGPPDRADGVARPDVLTALSCDRLLGQHRATMNAHPGFWLQRQIDRQADAAGVVEAVAAYRRLADLVLEPPAAGRRAAKKTQADETRLALIAQQAGIACGDADMNRAFDQIRAAPAAARDLVAARHCGQPISQAALGLHLWSYLHATEVDLGGIGLTCEGLIDLGAGLAGCRHLTILRLANNALDLRLGKILTTFADQYPLLSCMLLDNNPIAAPQMACLSDVLARPIARMHPMRRLQLLLQHCAVAEVEVAAGVQARLRGGRRGSAVFAALSGCLDDLPRVMELRLTDIRWTWPHLLATVTALGRRGRNLRHLTLEVDGRQVLAGSGIDAALPATTSDLALLDAPLRALLDLRTGRMLAPLIGCQALTSLRLPGLLLGHGALAALEVVVGQLPALVDLTFLAHSSDPEEAAALARASHQIAAVAAAHDPTCLAGGGSLGSRRQHEGARCREIRRLAAVMAHERAVSVGVPADRLPSPPPPPRALALAATTDEADTGRGQGPDPTDQAGPSSPRPEGVGGPAAAAAFLQGLSLSAQFC